MDLGAGAMVDDGGRLLGEAFDEALEHFGEFFFKVFECFKTSYLKITDSHYYLYNSLLKLPSKPVQKLQKIMLRHYALYSSEFIPKYRFFQLPNL